MNSPKETLCFLYAQGSFSASLCYLLLASFSCSNTSVIPLVKFIKACLSVCQSLSSRGHFCLSDFDPADLTSPSNVLADKCV